jgi:site-specific DNA recombinase
MTSGNVSLFVPKTALNVARLSVWQEGQTGLGTQLKRNALNIEMRGLVEVGQAVDRGVSAKIPPFERPELGEWLNERVNEFDALVVYKIDRIARRLKDMVWVFEWCEQNNKVLISTEEGIDFSTPLGKMFGQLLAMFAEMELKAISERVTRSRAALREQGRFAGGVIPFGRCMVPNEVGDGWKTALDPVYGSWLLEMIERFISRPSFSGVAAMLNFNEVPTAMAIAQVLKAAKLEGEEAEKRVKDAESRRWTNVSVKDTLTSRTLLGYGERSDGQLIVDEDGEPIQFGEPIIDMAKWSELQQAVARASRATSKGEPSPLSAILLCDDCERSAYFTKQKPISYSRYRCVGVKSRGILPCEGQNFHAEKTYEMVEDIILKTIGHCHVMRRIENGFVVKANQRLAAIDEAMDRANAEFKSGKKTLAEFMDIVGELGSKRQEVQVETETDEMFRWENTGRTYREWWVASTVGERREFMQDHDVRFYAKRGEGKYPILRFDPGALLVTLERQGVTDFNRPVYQTGIANQVPEYLPKGWTLEDVS